TNLGTGPGRQISLGEVAVSENARIHGRVRRQDVASAGGHAGTVVFVPEGPFTTFTSDDGSYSLSELPSGSLRVSFFRSGYQTIDLDLDLRAGEDFAVKDIAL